MRPMLLLIATTLLLALCAATTHAWSLKEHVLVTRLAVQRILEDPSADADLKAFLREAAPDAGDMDAARKLLIDGYVGPDPKDLRGLDYWAVFPDLARKLDRDAPVPPFGVSESLMHYVDLELFQPNQDVQRYKHDLSGKPTFKDVPRDRGDPRLVQAGYLPLRVEQVYADLVKAVRDGRLQPKGEGDRDNALVLSGYLAHYLADNTQPHHSTLDYKSLSYFGGGPRDAPNVHGMFEYGMVDWENRPFPELRGELWDKITANLERMDAARAQAKVAPFRPFEDVTRMALWSYDALPLIGEAAQIAAGQKTQDGDPSKPVGAPKRGGDDFDVEAFFRHEGEVGGETMSVLDLKARQLSIAVTRIEAALRQAWGEAQ